MKQHEQQSTTLSYQLGRYGLAAGAMGLVSQSVYAELQPFNPPGGLPIIVNFTTATSVDIDVDGDLDSDFTLFRLTDYGGGFGIATFANGLGNAIDTVQSASFGAVCCDAFDRARRYDPTEWGDPDRDGDFVVETNTSTGDQVINIFSLKDNFEFRAFQNNPGFIHLRLKADTMAATDQFGAYLEVVINEAGDELSIIGGAFEDSASTQIQFPALTPPAAAEESALGQLARGND